MGNQLTFEDCEYIRTDEERFSHLTPIRVIGRGAHASAILCYDGSTNQEVVVKIMDDDDESYNEVLIHCMLSHLPWVIKLHDYFKTKISDRWYKLISNNWVLVNGEMQIVFDEEDNSQDQEFIVVIMEKGHETISELLENLRQHKTFIPEDDLIQIIVQLLCVVYAMNELGICHQDFHLHNVMYTFDSTPSIYLTGNVEIPSIKITTPYKIKVIDFNESTGYYDTECGDIPNVALTIDSLIPYISDTHTSSMLDEIVEMLESDTTIDVVVDVLKSVVFSNVVGL